MSFIRNLAKQAAQALGAAISHVRPGSPKAKRLLNSSASNRQSGWHYGTKVAPKKPVTAEKPDGD